MTNKPRRGQPPKPYHIKKRRVNIMLPGWLADWLQAQDNQSVTVSIALVKANKLKLPKD